jgi:hypothetical protein
MVGDSAETNSRVIPVTFLPNQAGEKAQTPFAADKGLSVAPSGVLRHIPWGTATTGGAHQPQQEKLKLHEIRPYAPAPAMGHLRAGRDGRGMGVVATSSHVAGSVARPWA